MTGPNLTRALAELMDTGMVHYIDETTGARRSVTLDEYLVLLPNLPDHVRVRMTEVSARAESARVLTAIAGRN